jgi:hypothetical protein
MLTCGRPSTRELSPANLHDVRLDGSSLPVWLIGVHVLAPSSSAVVALSMVGACSGDWRGDNEHGRSFVPAIRALWYREEMMYGLSRGNAI